MNAIEIKNLTKVYGKNRGIQDINISVKEGEIYGFIGPNGAGKTTLFSVASGFLKPTQGKVIYEDGEITKLPTNIRAEKGIARTFQIVQPFAGLNVLENIVVGAFLRNHKRDEAEKIAKEIAELVGLSKHLYRSAQGLTVAGRK